MTKNTDTQEPTIEDKQPQAVDTGEPIEAAAEVDASLAEENQDTGSNPNREAAKYRRQLRDTEAERDALAEQLTAAKQQILRNMLEEDSSVRVTSDSREKTVQFNTEATSDTDLEALATEGEPLTRATLNQHLQQLYEVKPWLFKEPERTFIPAGVEKEFSFNGSMTDFVKSFIPPHKR